MNVQQPTVKFGPRNLYRSGTLSVQMNDLEKSNNESGLAHLRAFYFACCKCAR